MIGSENLRFGVFRTAVEMSAELHARHVFVRALEDFARLIDELAGLCDHTAEEVIRELSAGKTFADPIVTAVEPATEFYPAEDYHQQYFENHPSQPYCAFTVAPKVRMFRNKFAARAKAGAS